MKHSRNISLKLSAQAQRNLSAYSARHGTTPQAAIDKILRGLKNHRGPSKPHALSPTKTTLDPLALNRNAVLAIRERIDSGEPYRLLASEYGCGLATIQRAYHGRGRYGEFNYGHRKPTPVALCRKVRKARSDGMTYPQIERTLKVSQTTAKRIVNRIGPYADR